VAVDVADPPVGVLVGEVEIAVQHQRHDVGVEVAAVGAGAHDRIAGRARALRGEHEDRAPDEERGEGAGDPVRPHGHTVTRECSTARRRISPPGFPATTSLNASRKSRAVWMAPRTRRWNDEVGKPSSYTGTHSRK